MPLSDRKADATNYPLNKILKIRFAPVVCFISIFSLNNSDNLKVRAKEKITLFFIALFYITGAFFLTNNNLNFRFFEYSFFVILFNFLIVIIFQKKV